VSSEWTRVGVVRESIEGERRVALVPKVVAALVGKGVEVSVEAHAGAAALIPDEAYADVGAAIGDAADVEGRTLIGFLAPRNADNQVGARR
jgi:NAD(P) transhydrogenase subunit alpha